MTLSRENGQESLTIYAYYAIIVSFQRNVDNKCIVPYMLAAYVMQIHGAPDSLAKLQPMSNAAPFVNWEAAFVCAGIGKRTVTIIYEKLR